MSKETFYFSHDYTARTDPKIKRLLSKHGLTGYGVYWSLIEDLYINANALPTDYESIAYDMRITENVVKSVINDFDLFVINDGFFMSLSVERRLNMRTEKSEKARQSALNRWKKDANAMRTQSERNAIKKRKENEIKEDIKILFDDFWNLYDKKTGSKPNAKKAWDKLSVEDKQNAFDLCKKYQATCSEKKYIKDAQGYLNQKYWIAYMEAKKPDGKKSISDMTPQEIADLQDKTYEEFFK